MAQPDIHNHEEQQAPHAFAKRIRGGERGERFFGPPRTQRSQRASRRARGATGLASGWTGLFLFLGILGDLGVLGGQTDLHSRHPNRQAQPPSESRPAPIFHLLDDEAAGLDASGFRLASRSPDVRADASGPDLLTPIDATPYPLRRLHKPVLFLHARLANLTEREHEVMLRVAAGKLNKVIADELHVSVRTVEVHRARVCAKLGVRSAAEVATLLAG